MEKGFIDRRREIRQHYRNFEKRKTPHLYFTGLGGLGGLGKTTLAGHFFRMLKEEHPGLEGLGFTFPLTEDKLFLAIEAFCFKKGIDLTP